MKEKKEIFTELKQNEIFNKFWQFCKNKPKVILCIVGILIFLIISITAIVVNNKQKEKFTGYEIKIHVDFNSNWIFSKYDVLLFTGKQKSVLEHGENKDIVFYLEKGTHTLTFENYDDSSIKSEFTIEVYSNMEIGYSINCYSDRIDAKNLYTDSDKSIAENEIKIDFDNSKFTNKNYKDVINTFKELGFTNIIEKPLYDIVLGLTTEGSVKSVTINGLNDYRRGNVFDKDTEIIVSYHLKEVDDPSKAKAPYDGSTAQYTDYKTVENAFKEVGFTNITLKEEKTSINFKENIVYSIYVDGKYADRSILYNVESEVVISYYIYEKKESNGTDGITGLYSYKSKGGQYDTYYIIDLDKGYVYSFTEGLGSETCEKVKITSGNLNSTVIITYHDGNDTWSYKLYYKIKNQPYHLIVEDNDHFKYDFYSTDLGDAIKKRDKKRIVNY